MATNEAFTLDYEVTKAVLPQLGEALDVLKRTFSASIDEVAEIGKKTEIPNVVSAVQILVNTNEDAVKPNIKEFERLYEELCDNVKHYEKVAMGL